MHQLTGVVVVTPLVAAAVLFLAVRPGVRAQAVEKVVLAGSWL